MATIIDELIVLLKLDGGKEFGEDQRKIDEGLKKTGDRATATGKELEFRAKRSMESFSRFRDEVIALFAAFTAGVGLKNFIESTIKSEANLGRMSHALDTSVETLSQWQGVLKRNGGTAEDATAAFRTLADIIAEVQTTGTTSKGGLLTAMGVTGGVNQLHDKVGTLLAMADRASHMDPQTASFMLRQIGFSEAMVNVMLKGRRALLDMLEAQKQLGITTEADVRAAQKLQDSIEGLKTASSRVGAAILTALEPAMDMLAKLFTGLAEWAQHNQPIVVGALGAMTAALVALGIAAAGAAIAASPILGPLIVVTAIAAAAGAAIGLLWEALVRGTHAFMEFVRHNKAASDALEEVIEAARGLWDAIKDLLEPLKPVADAIGHAFAEIGKAIQDAFGSASKVVVKGFIDFLVNSFHAVADLIKAITALLHGDLKAAFEAANDFQKDTADGAPRASTNKQSLPGAAPSTGAPPATGAPAISAGGQSKTGASGKADIAAMLVAKGISQEVAKGVVAGAYAESRLDPNKVNLKSGAFGIAQWLGPRKRELFRRYGDHPTLQQQVEFLAWELMGGDRGGKSVLSQKTALAAMMAFIRNFERPDLPGSTAASEGDIRRGSIFLAANGNVPPSGVLAGAGLQAQRASSPQVVRTDVQIDSITVQTAATDADGIARDLAPAIKRRYVQQVNPGLA
jgi:hypothetical protein